MKSNKCSFLLLLLFIGSTPAFAQSAAEVRFVEAVNPRYPNNVIFTTLSSTTKPIAIAIPIGMLAVSLINNNKKGEFNAYEVAAGIAISAAATTVLKAIVNRPRPYVTYSDIYPDQIDNSSSFPSGHSSVAFATATSLTLITKKWYVAVPAYVWACGVGYSRMYLGQHYPSDVAAGAVVGVASAYAAHWLNKKFFGKKKK
jgi:undecaprenyl-diphosphatase